MASLPFSQLNIMKITESSVVGAKLISPKRLPIIEVFGGIADKKAFEAAGLHLEFVQDDHAFFTPLAAAFADCISKTPPFALDKLVRVSSWDGLRRGCGPWQEFTRPRRARLCRRQRGALERD